MAIPFSTASDEGSVLPKQNAITELRKESSTSAPSPFDNPHVRRWGPPIALALLAFFFLLPTLRGVYIWDDDQWLTANPSIRTADGLSHIWLDPAANPQYYPLVFTTFWLEYQLTGSVGPRADIPGTLYHLDNVLLHIATALIIFYLLKKLKLPGGVLGAWLAATIFAIHPINVESVAWVAERKNVLCGVFFFAALLYGLKFFHVVDVPGSGENSASPAVSNQKHYFAAIVLFLLAMLSKTIACMLPPVLLLLIWWRRGRIRLRELLLSVPFFLIAGGLGLVTTWTEHGSVGTTGPEWIYSPLGRFLAAHPDQITASLKFQAFAQELLARTLIAGQAVWFYIGKIFWPNPVVQVYPRFAFDIFQPTLYVAPVALLALVAILYFLRKKITRGPVTALLFFVIVLFPALGYINFYTMLYTFVADHYQYLACISIIVLAVETLLWVLRTASANVPTDTASKDDGAARFFNLTTGLLGGGLILSLGILTRGVSDLYTSSEALWRSNVIANPAAFAAWNNLATAIVNRPANTMDEVQENRAEALDVLQHSIAAAPQDWRAYHTAGMIYLDENNPDKAAEFLNKGESLMPPFVRNGRANFFLDQARLGTSTGGGAPLRADIPDAAYSPSYLLGRNFEDHEQWDRAIASFTDDLRQNPGNAEAYFHLGNCYVGKSDFAAAIVNYTAAIDKRPTYAEAYFNRGLCRRALKQEQEGIADLLKARELDPMVLRHVPALLQEAAKQFRAH